MANEIILPLGQTGKTVYALIFSRTGTIWNTNTSAFESYASANLANYVISLLEQGVASGIYEGNFPSSIVAGVYGIVAKVQATGSAAESDQVAGRESSFNWNGTVTLPLSDLATSGQISQFSPIRLAKGTMIKNFPIYLKSSSDHLTGFTSGVVSGQIARDGGSFGTLASGAFVEGGLGWYTLQALTSGDTLGDTIRLYFTANGISGGSSDPLAISLLTQRVSGTL